MIKCVFKSLLCSVSRQILCVPARLSSSSSLSSWSSSPLPAETPLSGGRNGRFRYQGATKLTARTHRGTPAATNHWQSWFTCVCPLARYHFCSSKCNILGLRERAGRLSNPASTPGLPLGSARLGTPKRRWNTDTIARAYTRRQERTYTRLLAFAFLHMQDWAPRPHPPRRLQEIPNKARRRTPRYLRLGFLRDRIRDFRYYDSSEMFLDGIDGALLVWRLSLIASDLVFTQMYNYRYV